MPLDNQCFHCGTPCDDAIASPSQEEQYFCCYGCLAVSQTIYEGGLGAFYQYRDATNRKADAPQDFSSFDIADVQQDFVEHGDDGQCSAHLALNGISCAACVWLIEKHLQKLAGVIAVRVNASSHRATIQYDSTQLKLSTIFAALESIGYSAQPLVQHTLEAHWLAQQKQQLMRLGVAGIGMMQAGMVALALHFGAFHGMDEIWIKTLRWVNLAFTLPIIFYSAQPFFKAAIRALKARHLVMDVSVSLALILAFIASIYATFTLQGEVYFDSIAMFTFFLLLGRYFEQRVRWKNNQANVGAHQLLPMTVRRQGETGETDTIPLRSLHVGDVLLVNSGERFAADGTVLSGTSEVDESLITGESVPQKKSVGDRVLAGSFNGGTRLQVRVDAVGANTQLASIENLVAQAESNKPRQAMLADRLAGVFVALVLAISTSVWLVWLSIDASKALWVALSVLVVTCPCALSLATPTALSVAVNRLRKSGLLITGANTLEGLESITTVVLDKTGTLTEGKIQVAETRLLRRLDKQRVLSIAAALEAVSSHPIARAFAAHQADLIVEESDVSVGFGVSGKIDGELYRIGSVEFAWPQGNIAYPGSGLWVLLADHQAPLAWFNLSDQLRPNASNMIAQLQAQGLGVVLLSGDRRENVATIAQQLGIQQWQGEMVPAQKLEKVRELQKQGQRVLMVGDGLNDLPVISGADLAFAMGSATNLTRSKADAVLLHDDLNLLLLARDLAQKTGRTIVQNLMWAIGYNVIALPLAVLGMVPPWAAAIGMSTSSLVVVLNALRLSHLKSKA